MWETLIEKVNSTLDKITLVKSYANYPKTKIDTYPHVFFSPDSFNNEFHTQTENFATYRFGLFIIISKANTTAEQAFGTTLPKIVDDLIQQFDEDWNQGTIDNHRCWVRLGNADRWASSIEERGEEYYVPLFVEFKLLTNNS